MSDRISPKLAKGFFATVPQSLMQIASALRNNVVFQFNPDSIKRKLTPNITEVPPIQFKDFPSEEWTFTAHFDATDYMDAGDELAASLGITPQLSAMELMLYPSILSIAAGTILAETGTIEIGETDVPLTLFGWGAKLVVPVQIKEIEVTEQAYNNALMPIRAEVGVTMNVLSYSNFKTFKNAGFFAYMAHHTYKESMGLLNTGYTAYNTGKYYSS